MIELEQQRQEKEKERQIAIDNNDIIKLTMLSQSTSGNGRGRGRGGGISNLPAWMTAGQNSDSFSSSTTTASATATVTTTNNTTSNNTQFDDSTQRPTTGPTSSGGSSGAKRSQGGIISIPTCIVLLKNMIDASNVDAELTVETKEECMKYGDVLSCHVYVVPSYMKATEEERVRIFVEFGRQDGAIRYGEYIYIQYYIYSGYCCI